MEGHVVVALIIAILLSASWGLDDAYLGCFYDVYHAPIGPPDPLFRVLPLGKLRSTDMTIGRCITHCVELQDDITYAGLEAGDECYCGTAVADYDQGGRGRRPDRDCLGRPCAGNVNQACGDGFSIAVYNVDQIHCEVPETRNFQNPPGFVPVQMFETFACLPGYTLMGTPTVQCIFDDSIGDTRWVPDLPMCLFTGLSSTVSTHDVTGSTPPTRADRTGAIAGAVFGLLLAVLILVIVIYVWKRHATSHKQTRGPTSTNGEGTILVEPANSDTYLDLDPTSRNADTEYQGLYTNPDADNAAVHPDANANDNLDPASHNKDAEYQGIHTNPDDSASHRNSGTRQESHADISLRRVPIPPALVKRPDDSGSYYVNVKDKFTK